MKKLIILSLAILYAGSSFANQRNERPIQLQYLPAQGGSLGFHFTELIYFGVSSLNRIGLTDSPRKERSEIWSR